MAGRERLAILACVQSVFRFKAPARLALIGALLAALLAPAPATAAPTELLVATVNNGHMLELQQLSRHFTDAHPGIRLRWVTFDEGVLRQRVTEDVAARKPRYDVVTIGLYEAPVWAREGRLRPIETGAEYDADDLLPPLRQTLSAEGRLYAAPFYGESSMLYYRTDLARAAGVRLGERPTWAQLREFAAKAHDPKNGVHGICLRGKPGWGDNITIISSLANTFGGQWFDMQWRPQLTSRPWLEAMNFLVSLMRDFGPPDAAELNHNELLALFSAGRCAAWVDATIAAAQVTDPKLSPVAGRVGLAMAPTALTHKGANWLWSWNLAIPAHGDPAKAEAAQRFVRWATSREYVGLVARTLGWRRVPTGNRLSTYGEPGFQAVASAFANAELTAIASARPYDATLPKSPYVGVAFASIPEFQAIGNFTGQQITAALSGRQSVEQALQASQAFAEKALRRSGRLR